jgi:nucleoid-associated protein YejK
MLPNQLTESQKLDLIAEELGLDMHDLMTAKHQRDLVAEREKQEAMQRRYAEEEAQRQQRVLTGFTEGLKSERIILFVNGKITHKCKDGDLDLLSLANRGANASQVLQNRMGALNGFSEFAGMTAAEFNIDCKCSCPKGSHAIRMFVSR